MRNFRLGFEIEQTHYRYHERRQGNDVVHHGNFKLG
jgi:hypothetical protein